MQRIISYKEIPPSNGQSVYLRFETDPGLYIALLQKGYRIINNINYVDESTIYITGRRQDYFCFTFEEYKNLVHNKVETLLARDQITKPKTVPFSYQDLIHYKYKLPFVLKNENQNGGREKFLIATEEDYDNLMKACVFLLNKDDLRLSSEDETNTKYHINYYQYLTNNFTVQEFIHTPSQYNTTVRLLTSSSKDLLYGVLKYNEMTEYKDNTSLLGYLLSEVFPLSSKSIVSNTLSGGKNILLGEKRYPKLEQALLESHAIKSEQFHHLIEVSESVHEACKSELGIICGFDYIYDIERKQWFLLEYHSRPMLGDYSKRQRIKYNTEQDSIKADGRIRATALALTLKKKK